MRGCLRIRAWLLFFFFISTGLTKAQEPPIPFKEDGKWGYLNSQDSVVIIENGYDSALNFWEGRALVMKRGRWGMIDREGKWLARPRYDRISDDFRDGLALVNRKGRFGYIGEGGKLVIKTKYLDARPFILARARVKDRNGYFFIDTLGRPVTSERFDEADLSFLPGLARVSRKGKWGAMDRDGNLMLPLVFEQIEATLKPGVWRVVKGDSVGYANQKGKTALAEFEYLLPEISDSLTIHSAREEILHNRACLSASKLTPDEVVAMVEDAGAPSRMQPLGPAQLRLTVWEDECAWLITTEYTGTTREGDCQFTNGCTVRLTRKTWIDAIHEFVLDRKEERALYPNYE